MEKYGIITFTIKNAHSKRDLIASLLIGKIREEFELYDAIGYHDILYCIDATIPARILLNNIYNKVQEVLHNIDISIYFDSTISILISLDNKVCEIQCSSWGEDYIISKYIDGQIIGKED